MRLTTSAEQLAVPVNVARPTAAASVVVLQLLVFALDRATGAAPVQHLYYLPIIIAALGFGIAGGIASALSAIVLYHTANPHLLTFRYGESDLVQMALFLVVGVVTAKLALDARRLRRLATTDDLTGLHNLRSFESRLASMVATERRSNGSLALLVLDVDRLKSLNDQYGHLTGAEAVRTVGHIIGELLPIGAVGCRYGGDEFVIAIPQVTPVLAYRAADMLCRAVRATAPILAGRPLPAGTLSISVGGACATFARSMAARPLTISDVETGEGMFRAADLALYRAKARGRNQVCVPFEDFAFASTAP